MLEATHNVLESLWASLSPLERVVASALAQGQRWSELFSSLDAISAKLEEARKSLIEWDLLDKETYRFRVRIIQRWIATKKNFSFKELDQISPEAQEIYTVAKKLLATHPANAQILLEQTREINPYHTQASLLLAELMEQKKQYDKAKEILEKLYRYRAEEARQPLVRVLLKRAEALELDEVSHHRPLKFLFLPHANLHEEQRFKLYQRVIELEPNNSEAFKKERDIKQQRKARVWKQRISNRLKEQRTWLTVSFIAALVVSFWVSLQAYPEGIVFEVKQEKETYLLIAAPSATKIQLQWLKLKIDRDLSKTTFVYRDRKINLSANYPEICLQKTCTIDNQFLFKELPDLKPKEFSYPSKSEQFNLKLVFEFSEKTLPLVDFKCEVSTTDKREIACEVRQRDFFSIFRGIPWLGWAIVGWLVLAAIIKLIYTIRNREKNDVY
jgi:tetratricopeptide (TPR) repeat protein